MFSMNKVSNDIQKYELSVTYAYIIYFFTKVPYIFVNIYCNIKNYVYLCVHTTIT